MPCFCPASAVPSPRKEKSNLQTLFTPLEQTEKATSERSAAEWINEYTITEAKVLLRFSELSVQQVAEKLNFSSQSAFGKYFKQYVGTSPKTFRRESREG